MTAAWAEHLHGLYNRAVELYGPESEAAFELLFAWLDARRETGKEPNDNTQESSQ